MDNIKIFELWNKYCRSITAEIMLNKVILKEDFFKAMSVEESQDKDVSEWFINNTISLINGETLLAQKENRPTDFTDIRKTISKMLKESNL